LNQLITHPNETNALAATSSALLAFVAVIIAAISIIYTIRGLRLQRVHNRLSVVPVPFIALADYENLLRVKVRNDGIGPLIINSVTYERDGFANEYEDLVSYMPSLPQGMSWSNFSSGYVRSVRPGDEIFMLELEGQSENENFAKFRDECRRRLSNITLTIEYTDIYGTKAQVTKRNLNWFGRRLALSKKPASTQ
jgi:hypothetical protein